MNQSSTKLVNELGETSRTLEIVIQRSDIRFSEITFLAVLQKHLGKKKTTNLAKCVWLLQLITSFLSTHPS